MRTAAIGIAQTQPGHRLWCSRAFGGSLCDLLMRRLNAAVPNPVPEAHRKLRWCSHTIFNFSGVAVTKACDPG